MKLFLGIFVSVMSLFALVYVVQNPFYRPSSQAATINTGKTTIIPK